MIVLLCVCFEYQSYGGGGGGGGNRHCFLRMDTGLVYGQGLFTCDVRIQLRSLIGETFV